MTAIRMQRIAGSDVGTMRRSRLERRTLFGALMRRSRAWDRALQRWRSEGARARLKDRHGRSFDKVWDQDMAAMVLKGLHAIGNACAVARALGVSTPTFYRYRLADPCFQVRWNRMLNMRFEELEEILMKRAVYGFEEDVWYRGQYLGKRICYDHEMAMRLLELALKREKAARRYAREGWRSAENIAHCARSDVDNEIQIAHAWKQIEARDAAERGEGRGEGVA